MTFRFPQIRSLRVRIVLTVIVIEVVMLSILVWINISAIVSTHEDRLFDTAASILQQFSETTGRYLAEEDYAALEEYAQKAANHKELSYLAVLNLDGEPVIQLGDFPGGNLPIADEHPNTVNDEIYDVQADILLGGGYQGKVIMGFSLKLMHEARDETLFQNILIVVGEVLLSMIAAMFFGFYLTRNLMHLEDAARGVEKGDFTISVPVTSQDEIGVTAMAFNRMIEEIADRSQKLKESEAQVRLLLNSTAEAIYGLDLNGNCTFCNPACLSTLGYENETELLGKNMHDLIHHTYDDGSPYRNEACQIYQAFREEKGTHVTDEVLWRKDGVSFPAEYWSYPTFQEEAIIGTVVTFFDITKRKHAEQQFRDLVEAAPDGIVITNNRGEIVLVNGQTEKIFGYSRTEIIGKTIEMLIPNRYAEVHRKHRLDYLSNTKTRPMGVGLELNGLNKNGMDIPVEISLSPLETADGVLVMAAVRDITERKQAERDLRKSENLYSSLAEASPVGIFRALPSGDCIYVNERWCQIAGLAFEEAKGQGWGKGVHPEDKERVFGEWAKATTENLPFKQEYRFQTSKNSTTWVYGQAVAEKDDQGLITGYVGTITDITERKQAEEALLLSRERFQTLFNDSPVPLWEEDFTELYAYLEKLKEGVRDFREYFDENPAELQICIQKIIITDVNQAVLKLHHAKSKDELLGNLEKTFSEKSYDVFKEELIAITAGQLEFESKAEVKTLTGEARYIFLRLKIDKNQPKSIRALLATTDIAEHKRTEEKAARLGRILEDSLNEIYIFDAETLQFIQVNEGARRNLGYSMAELRHLTPVDLKPEFTHETFEKLMQPLKAQKKEKVQFTTKHKRKDGSLYPVEVHLQLSTQEVEAVFVAIILDITERQHAEEQLSEYRNHLEELIEELKAAQKELLTKERLAAIGRVASGIAHELRNPLGAIRNAVYYLNRKTPDSKPKWREYFDIIDQEIQVSDQIISNLLELTRPRKLKSQTVDLGNLLQGIIEKNSPAKNLICRFDFNPEPFFVEGDTSKLQQVFGNLLLNAMQAMDGNGEIAVTAMHEPEYDVILFRDNGPGISAEHYTSVFEPLYSTKAKGIGLGLWICREIIEIHGGKITLERSRAKGTTFKIQLPRKQKDKIV